MMGKSDKQRKILFIDIDDRETIEAGFGYNSFPFLCDPRDC